jgi:hypothetical protein
MISFNYFNHNFYFTTIIIYVYIKFITIVSIFSQSPSHHRHFFSSLIPHYFISPPRGKELVVVKK